MVLQPDHRAGQIVLWNLSALLERELVQPFQADYRRLVDEASSRLSDAGPT